MKNYDVCVIGAGSAGLVAATTANRLGAKTLLVERDKIGGECLHSGCVPSKTLIHAARLMREMRGTESFGLPKSDPDASFRFDRVMTHVRDTVASVYKSEDKPMFEAMGIDVSLGECAFISPTTLRLADGEITSRYFVICTGSSPLVPEIEGIGEIPVLTNENVWDLQTLPGDLLVIGGGPIGIELAQSFARFGSRVTVAVRGRRILKKEEPEISEALLKFLEEESIRFRMGAQIHRFNRRGERIEAEIETGEGMIRLEADAILLAVGRKPNVAGLNLEAAGVRTGPGGIPVDDQLRTNVGHIYACGDVVGRHQFTHAASYHAEIAVQAMLRGSEQTLQRSVMPWVTFTDPEVAQVGLGEEEARKRDPRVQFIRVDCNLDRFITEGKTRGFLKVVLDGDDDILGAHAIGAHAGEFIQTFTLAIQHGLTLRQIAETIYPYPTFSEIARKACVRHLRKRG